MRSPARAELRGVLGDLRPRIVPGTFVFVPVSAPPAGSLWVALVREDEGLTAVLPQAAADELGLAYDYVSVMISLGAGTDLALVGLTAAVAEALEHDGISCNIIAGLRHDHIFVPAGRAPEALAVLGGLGQTGAEHRE